MDKSNILEYLKSHSKEYQEKYAIKKIGLFGSFANNNANPASDIDIIYETSTKDLTFFQSLELEEQLKKEFQRNIDLVNINYINPLIKRKMIKDAIYV